MYDAMPAFVPSPLSAPGPSWGSADFASRARGAMQAAAAEGKRAQRARKAAEPPVAPEPAPLAPLPAGMAPVPGTAPTLPPWAVPVLAGAGLFLVGTLLLLAVTRPAPRGVAP
jgi:hypothetical protein